MSTAEKEFLKKFNFCKKMAGFVGIERERFLANDYGIVAAAKKFLCFMRDDPRWTHELSACQVEDRTIPQRSFDEIRSELLANDMKGSKLARALDLKLITMPVAGYDMPLDIYPNP